MLGWSDGGITALCAAILHPKAIEKVAGIELNITFDIYDNKKAPDKSHYICSIQVVVWGSNAYIVQADIDMIKQVSTLNAQLRPIVLLFQNIVMIHHYRLKMFQSGRLG